MRTLFFSLLFLLYLPVNSQVTLDSIMYYVRENNPDLKTLNARIKAYNEYAKGARALHPPQVGAGLFMTPYNTRMWDEMGSFMISGEQMITHPKKRNANAEYMNSMSAIDSSMRKVMLNDLLSMAKMNYYEWVIMQKKLSVLKKSEELIEYLVESTELRYTYGMTGLNAYYKAKAMLGDIQSMILMINLEMEQKRIFLNTLMNREPYYPFEIDTVFVVKNYDSLIIDSSLIIHSRSEFAGFSNEIKMMRAKSNYEYSLRLPDFGIRYDHMMPFGTAPQQYSIMFMVTIPFVPWSSGMYSSNIRGLKFEIESIREKQSSLVNTIQGEIESIQRQITYKKRQLNLTETVIIPAMEKNYQTELLAYEQNTEMLFMVLDAWENLNTTRLLYYDQLMEILVLQTRYEKQLELK